MIKADRELIGDVGPFPTTWLEMTLEPIEYSLEDFEKLKYGLILKKYIYLVISSSFAFFPLFLI